MFAGGKSRGKYIEFIYYPFVPPLHASAEKREGKRVGGEWLAVHTTPERPPLANHMIIS